MIAVGDTLHLKYVALQGRLESVTIRQHVRGTLYKDTFEWYYNENELISLEEAAALVAAYKAEHPPVDVPLPPPEPILVVNGTYYLKYVALQGRLESVTVKEHVRGNLYKDTFNWYYNWNEFITYEEAVALVNEFKENNPPLPMTVAPPEEIPSFGDTLYLRDKAAAGRLESITIKQHLTSTLFKDTFNFLYNEEELVTLEEAQAIMDERLEFLSYMSYTVQCYPIEGTHPIYTSTRNRPGEEVLSHWAGKTQLITIKDIISVMNRRTKKFVHLYVDTLNGLWNEWELTKE